MKEGWFLFPGLVLAFILGEIIRKEGYSFISSGKILKEKEFSYSELNECHLEENTLALDSPKGNSVPLAKGETGNGSACGSKCKRNVGSGGCGGCGSGCGGGCKSMIQNGSSGGCGGCGSGGCGSGCGNLIVNGSLGYGGGRCRSMIVNGSSDCDGGRCRSMVKGSSGAVGNMLVDDGSNAGKEGISEQGKVVLA